MRRFFPALTAFAALLCLNGAARAGDVSLVPAFGLTPWGSWSTAPADRWNGSYFSMSSGFAMTSMRKGPTVGGPTIGLDTGKSLRDGQWVYGVGASAEYMPTASRFSNNYALPFASRDFAGGGYARAGYLVRPDLLLYGTVGAVGISETWRMPTALGGRTESRTAIVPYAKAGAQWAVTDNLSLTFEVGVQQPVR